MPEPTAEHPSSHAVWRRFLLTVVTAGLVLLAIVSLIYRQDMRHQQRLLEQEAQHVLELQREWLLLELRSVVADLSYLSTQDALEQLASGDAAAAEELEAEYVSFAENKTVYDQVRFLDNTGQEVIRINYAGGAAEVVPKDELQSKATRYYFTQSLSLERGEVFVSPFDLNVEHGELQRPIRPVIRFATPVFDESGQRRGLLVLNYVGKRLLGKLKQVSRGFPGETMLLNPDGEYLQAGDAALEWGWLLGHGRSFRRDFAVAWERVREGLRRRFDLSGDHFLVQVVSPKQETARNAAGDDMETAEWSPSSLILLAYISKSVANAHSRTLLTQLLVMYVGVMAIVAVFAMYWARSRELRLTHERQIAESESRLRRLSRLLLSAQEDERRNLSRGLHDELGQQVTAISLDLKSLAKETHSERSRGLLDRVIGETDQLLHSLHEVASRVRPSVLDDLGLHDAIESYLSDFQRRTGIDVNAQMRFERQELPAAVGENAYRILQESLANVAKHADTRHVDVSVQTQPSALRMIVQDRGVGFEPAELQDSTRLGILGMRERVELLGGQFELESRAGEGTVIRVVIPIDNGEP